MARRRTADINRRLLATLIFLTRLLSMCIPLYLIPLYPPLLYPLQEAVASHSQALLLSFGTPAERDGLFITIVSGPFTFFVGPDCTGWKSAVLFTALVIAPAGVMWRKRAAGIALGLPALYAANVARVATVASAGAAMGEGAASVLHDFLWQWGLTLTVLFLWALFLLSSRAFGPPPWKNKHISARIKNKLCA